MIFRRSRYTTKCGLLNYPRTEKITHYGYQNQGIEPVFQNLKAELKNIDPMKSYDTLSEAYIAQLYQREKVPQTSTYSHFFFYTSNSNTLF